ncbi:MAG: hypothetical protein AB1488_06660 [Nitrospirota bacterium]
MLFTVLLIGQLLVISNLINSKYKLREESSLLRYQISEYRNLSDKVRQLPVKPVVLFGSENSYSAFQYGVKKLSSIYRLKASPKNQKVSSIKITDMARRDGIGTFIPLQFEVAYNTLSELARFLELIEEIFPVSVDRMEAKEGKLIFDFKLYVKEKERR